MSIEVTETEDTILLLKHGKPIPYRRCAICERFFRKVSARGWCPDCEREFENLGKAP